MIVSRYNMKKIFLLIVIVLLVLLLIIIFFKKKEDDIMKSNIKVLINNKEYSLILEDNNTVKSFLNQLPSEFSMHELNGNEKYVYMDFNLPTNDYKPGNIEKGDVMLFGDNCLVIFYKSFNTTYSYTKIGHIADLTDLDNSDISVKFESE